MATATRTADDRLAAFAEWERTERDTRTAYALLRLKSFDRVAMRLSDEDRFDIAFAIWDDYIQDHRHDDGPQDEADLCAHAQVFARIVPYLPAKDLIALALAAWGDDTFETPIVGDGGVSVGYFVYSSSRQRIVVERYPAPLVSRDPGASVTIVSTGKAAGPAQRVPFFPSVVIVKTADCPDCGGLTYVGGDRVRVHSNGLIECETAAKS